jgi:hypothetical protein
MLFLFFFLRFLEKWIRGATHKKKERTSRCVLPVLYILPYSPAADRDDKDIVFEVVHRLLSFPILPNPTVFLSSSSLECKDIERTARAEYVDERPLRTYTNIIFPSRPLFFFFIFFSISNMEVYQLWCAGYIQVYIIGVSYIVVVSRTKISHDEFS